MVALVTIQLIGVPSCVRPLVRFRGEWFRLRFGASVRPSPFVPSGYGFVSVRPSSFAFVPPEFPERYLFVAFRRGVRSRYCCRISALRVRLLHRLRVSRDSHGRLDSRRSQRFRNPAHDPQKEKNMSYCCSDAGGCAFVLFRASNTIQ